VKEHTDKAEPLWCPIL